MVRRLIKLTPVEYAAVSFRFCHEYFLKCNPTDESVELVLSESVKFIGELTGFPETPLKPKSLMSIPKRYNEHSRHFYMVTTPPLFGDKVGMGF